MKVIDADVTWYEVNNGAVIERSAPVNDCLICDVDGGGVEITFNGVISTTKSVMLRCVMETAP